MRCTFQEKEEINREGKKYHALEVTNEPQKMPCPTYQILNYQ